VDARDDARDHSQRAVDLQAQLEEAGTRESKLRTANKVGGSRGQPAHIYAVFSHGCAQQGLRDELRKIQAGVLMSEQQRNPGIGCTRGRRSESVIVLTFVLFLKISVHLAKRPERRHRRLPTTTEPPRHRRRLRDLVSRGRGVRKRPSTLNTSAT
jgi:hypothetical protein